MRTSRFRPLVFLVLSGTFLYGCGGKTVGKIAGQVTLNGEPVKVAKVTAYNDSGEVLAQAMVLDGKYELGDLPLGLVTLVVQTHTPDGQPVTNIRAPRQAERNLPAQVKKDLGKQAQEGLTLPTTLEPVPLKYTSTKQSDLKVTVAKGASVYDIAMTGKGEVPKAVPLPSGGLLGAPPGLPPGAHPGLPPVVPSVPLKH
jgi:hypothetical protein